MYRHILQQIRTKDEAQTIALEIDQLYNALFHAEKRDFQTALSTLVRSSVSHAISEALSQNDIEPRAFLEELRKKIANLKNIQMTVATAPTDAFLDELYTWMHDRFGAGWVLDLTVDVSIVGGFIMTCEGKYLDYSLRKKLNTMFEKDRKRLWGLVVGSESR